MCFKCFLSVRVMRRVETVRNNSRGSFVGKLDTDHSTDPRTTVRGHKIKHTKRVFLPIFFYPSGHPLAAADPLDALAEAWLNPLA